MSEPETCPWPRHCPHHRAAAGDPSQVAEGLPEGLRVAARGLTEARLDTGRPRESFGDLRGSLIDLQRPCEGLRQPPEVSGGSPEAHAGLPKVPARPPVAAIGLRRSPKVSGSKFITFITIYFVKVNLKWHIWITSFIQQRISYGWHVYEGIAHYLFISWAAYFYHLWTF